MNRFLSQPNRVLLGGAAIAVIAALAGLGTAAPAWAEYGFITIGNSEGGFWQCEGNFQGDSGNGLCVRRSEVNPGEAYKYYRGDIRNGTFAGRGKLVYENDDRYEGQMLNGRPNGYGTFISAENNRRYRGSFKNGEFHGRGEYTFANGSRYIGEFAGSQPHGRGVFTAYEDGKPDRPLYTYTGRFYLGTINGNGVVVSADNVRCEGVFYSNTLTGRGICTYPSGSEFRRYDGELRNGRPDGRGVITYSDGRRPYAGEFREGKPGLPRTPNS